MMKFPIYVRDADDMIYLMIESTKHYEYLDIQEAFELLDEIQQAIDAALQFVARSN